MRYVQTFWQSSGKKILKETHLDTALDGSEAAVEGGIDNWGEVVTR